MTLSFKRGPSLCRPPLIMSSQAGGRHISSSNIWGKFSFIGSSGAGRSNGEGVAGTKLGSSVTAVGARVGDGAWRRTARRFGATLFAQKPWARPMSRRSPWNSANLRPIADMLKSPKIRRFKLARGDFMLTLHFARAPHRFTGPKKIHKGCRLKRRLAGAVARAAGRCPDPPCGSARRRLLSSAKAPPELHHVRLSPFKT